MAASLACFFVNIMANVIWKARKNNFLGLPWTFTVYGFSEDRLFVKSGILSTREDEVRLYRITDITLTRSFWQRIMRMGSIQISSSDKSMGNFALKNIKNCDKIKEQLSELIEKERDSKRVSSREFVGFNDMEDNSVEDF